MENEGQKDEHYDIVDNKEIGRLKSLKWPVGLAVSKIRSNCCLTRAGDLQPIKDVWGNSENSSLQYFVAVLL